MLISYRYIALIETPCGFDPNFFQLLKEKLSTLSDVDLDSILALDEIGTRKRVSVDSKNLAYKGLVDFGEKDRLVDISEKADHGLVFMLVPINNDSAQPIAVFAANGPTPGSTLALLIIEAIILLERAGARIHGVVSDGAATNRKFWTDVGGNGKMNCVRNWFQHPSDENRKVYLFSDTPHLIKCVRNRLHSGNLKVGIKIQKSFENELEKLNITKM